MMEGEAAAMAGGSDAESPQSEDKTLNSPDDTADEGSDEAFQCFICLDLLYKPIVLACGHISCFWCVHKSMNPWLRSQCPICRQTYNHFPTVCKLIHLLLLKTHPVAYKRREKQILMEEKKIGYFSPQLFDDVVTKMVHDGLAENALENGYTEQVSITDVLCAACNLVLFRPAVLNCGHIYCEDCMYSLANGTLRCQVCKSCHPGGFPKAYPIIGKRHNCKDCVEKIGFDLCGDCYENRSTLPGRFNQQHTPEHIFELIESTGRVGRYAVQRR